MDSIIRDADIQGSDDFILLGLWRVPGIVGWAVIDVLRFIFDIVEGVYSIFFNTIYFMFTCMVWFPLMMFKKVFIRVLLLPLDIILRVFIGSSIKEQIDKIDFKAILFVSQICLQYFITTALVGSVLGLLVGAVLGSFHRVLKIPRLYVNVLPAYVDRMKDSAIELFSELYEVGMRSLPLVSKDVFLAEGDNEHLFSDLLDTYEYEYGLTEKTNNLKKTLITNHISKYNTLNGYNEVSDEKLNGHYPSSLPGSDATDELTASISAGSEDQHNRRDSIMESPNGHRHQRKSRNKVRIDQQHENDDEDGTQYDDRVDDADDQDTSTYEYDDITDTTPSEVSRLSSMWDSVQETGTVRTDIEELKNITNRIKKGYSSGYFDKLERELSQRK